MDSINLPVQNQPGCHLSNETGAIVEMPAPLYSWNCPPGLECLRQVNETLIHQKITFLDVIANSFKRNKYEIKNNLGQMIFFAVEDSSCCSRVCCGSARPFTLRIFNDMEQEVITLERALRCSRCCFPCCLQELNVQAPPGVLIGYVIQIWHPRLPMFIIQNAKRKDVLNISGPCCLWNCCREVNFEIKSVDEDDVVGKISKQSSGFIKEFLVNAGNIAIQFPEDVSETMKVLVLGACFLIDFIFFESRSNLQQFLFLRRIC
ncbi:phospholipid scramblase 1-like isoform X2 [Ochotona princeps]|uniref:phospholipid scramblase 1-like isoform X2 n=1 Tax=Ochotona princeps TaxID=9978 RepID=UPI002714F046|nr:phospholipid scramblase 1-like isoform X2 [Ochotona princeps]